MNPYNPEGVCQKVHHWDCTALYNWLDNDLTFENIEVGVR